MSSESKDIIDDEKVEIDELERKAPNEEVEAYLWEQAEHEQSVSQALRSNPWILLWFSYAVWIIMCCSFDSNAGSVVVGIPKFREDFGYWYEGDWILPASWQSAFSGGPAASQILGTFASGTIGDRVGRKMMCLICYIVLMIGITLEVVANITPNPSAVFFAGKFINGLGIGALQTTGFIYVSEISPVVLRGIFTSAAAVAFCIGTLVLALILNAFGDLPSSWAYKSAFLTQYGVTGVAIIFLPFIPETPTWLVMRGRDEDALKAQKRLGSTDETAPRKIANIKYTLKKAAEESAGVSYLELFRKSNLRRTVVACMPLSFQAWAGVFWIIGYFIYYCQLAGYSTAMSYKLNVTQQVLSTVGNIGSWFLIERLGRRFLTLWGMIGLTTLLLLAGVTATLGTLAGNRATISFILVYCWYYNLTIGATSWVAASEIGTSRLRNKTTGFGLAVQGALATFWNFVLPFMFNPNAGNLQGKVAFVFGATSLLTCVYTFYFHPETKGRSFQEIDEMFHKRIPARKFASFVTEAETRAKATKDEVVGTEQLSAC